jgi:hypothetical protein
MTCPPEIARVVLEILGSSALHIRAAGWSGDADRCALLADHIHNLPDLLADYSPDKLHYYWRAEKPAFEQAIGEQWRLAFQPLWEKLLPFVEDAKPVRAS